MTATFGMSFQPLATILVNVAGSCIIGFCYALIGMGLAMSDPQRGFLLVGFLGALTTFSSFSLDAVNLIEKGDVLVGAVYIVSSVILSLMGFWVVMVLTRNILAGP